MGEPDNLAASPFSEGKQMQRKNVFIDDCLIGQAATWQEVQELTKARGICFIGGPQGAEGPSGFYLTAAKRPATGLRQRIAG